MGIGNGNGNRHHETPSVSQDLIPTQGLCGARKKNGPGICRQKAMPNGRCRMHGGASLSGIASPSYKTGRYSKYMPAGIRDRYVEFLNDPTLTQLRPEIALVAQQLEEKFARLDNGESLTLWTRSKQLLTDYRNALEERSFGYDPSPSPDAILDQLGALLTAGERSLNIFAEIQPILEQHRKLVETENKRVASLNQSLSPEQAMAFVRSLGDSIKRHVTDPVALRAISEDFTRAISR